MAKILKKFKIFTALRKFYSTDEYIDFFKSDDELNEYCFYTLGNNDNDMTEFSNLIFKYRCPKLICLDAANGYMNSFIDRVKKLRDIAQNSYIMVGNVVDRDACNDLIAAGASCVKVGIGSGGHCTTRIVAGVGRPQLSTLLDCTQLKRGDICSDGGCVTPADVSKALGTNAEFVMLGSMLAGTDQSESKIITETYLNQTTCKTETKKFVIFYGMSSNAAMAAHNSLRGYRSSEGRVSKIEYRGNVENIVNHILGGIRSTLTYVGVNDIKDLPYNCNVVTISGKQTHNTAYQYNTIEDHYE